MSLSEAERVNAAAECLAVASVLLGVFSTPQGVAPHLLESQACPGDHLGNRHFVLSAAILAASSARIRAIRASFAAISAPHT